MEQIKIFGGAYGSDIPTNKTDLENEINQWLLSTHTELNPGKLYTKTIKNIFATNTIDPNKPRPKIVITFLVYADFTLAQYKEAYETEEEIGTISEETVTFVDGYFYIPVAIETFTFDEGITGMTATLTDGVWEFTET